MKKVILAILIFATVTEAAVIKWTAKTELTAIDDADILLVVDDAGGTPVSKKITVLNFFDTINTFSKLNTIVTDKTLVNEEDAVTWDALATFDLGAYFKNGAVAAGFIRIYEDSDDGGNYTKIQAIAQGGDITLTLPPDDGDAGEQLQTDGSGVLTWEAAGGAGATAWDDIADPDNGGLTTITFDNAELSLLTGDNDAAASFFILQNTDADHTGGNLYILDLDYGADDGDVDADYLKCQDSGGVVLTIQEDGNLSTIGFLATGSDPGDQGGLRMDNADIISWEDATETTITHVDNTGLLINLGLEIDGTLDADGIVALGDGGDNFSVASDGIDIDTSGNIANAGTVGSGAITSTGAVGGTDLTASDDIIGQDDLQLDSDAALIQLGEDQDVVLTHVADTGILLTGGTDEQLQFGDSGTYINQQTDGTLNMTGDTIIEITAPNTRLEFDDAAYLNIATADGGITTISQVSDGTDEIKIGDGGDLVSVDSGNWDVSNAGVFSGLTGITSTGNMDFGGGDLEIPQGQTPDTDGDIDADFTDGSLVIQHGSAHAELGGSTDVVVGKLIRSFAATIFAPDGVNDVITLKPIVAGEFPHGIVVTEVHMVVGTDSNYTIDVENWDDFDTINGANPSINSTAYTAGNDGEVTDSTITYSTIAAGQIIMLDIPATDIDWVNITVFYYEPIS